MENIENMDNSLYGWKNKFISYVTFKVDDIHNLFAIEKPFISQIGYLVLGILWCNRLHSIAFKIRK